LKRKVIEVDIYARLCSTERTFIIAEIGSNHNGDLDTALKLIDIAGDLGADAVKFQSFLADHLTTRDSDTYDLLKRIEVPRDWYPVLKNAAGQRGMVFFSTATNPITLGWMMEEGVEMFKLASPNITHIPLIRHTASLGKPIIMSTGMAVFQEIDEAVQAVLDTGNHQLALLHCVSEYPANPETIHLRFIGTLRRMYGLPVGFSDHTLGIGTAVGAVALGAQIIEKHITLSRRTPGPDHHYALEPSEFGDMVKGIREVEKAVGSPVKQLTENERRLRFEYFRSLHAACDIKTGEEIREEMIAVIRPANGLHPRHLNDIVGRHASCDLPKYSPLTWSHVH